MNIDAIKVTVSEMSLKTLATWFASSAMIFGGVVPYVPQYLEIRKSGNSEGFSTFVCLTLLIANTLRILFWFGKYFEIPLLAQSVVMIICMLAMVQLCTAVKARSEIVPSKTHHFIDFDSRYFWQWTDFGSYLQFLLVFTLAMGGITWLFLDVPIYVESLGFAAVFAEALLGAPQFYRNYQNGSTKGMSLKMVLFWLMGDIFKTAYFFVRKAPSQFWICGILQVCIDLSIIGQVYYYNTTTHVHVPHHLHAKGPKQ